MIRPLTIATFLMACGSGLYLYQSKHEVQLLDRTIERTVHETGALREQSRLLATEWNMLNDPERLRQFSDTYLSLRSIDPKQYTSLADLDGKLPAPRSEAPTPSAVEEPATVETSPQTTAEPVPATVAEEKVLPVPPVPATRPAPVAAVSAHPAEAKVASSRPLAVEPQGRPVSGADAHPMEPRPPEQRPAPRIADMHPEIRTPSALPPRPIILAAPRPQPAYTPVNTQPAPPRPAIPPAPAQAPYPGSLLGMAHGSLPPAPRPTPVSAAYDAN